MFGKKKCSTKFLLKNNDKNNFEKGQTDKFIIHSDYIGPLTKVRIEHDNSGRQPGCKIIHYRLYLYQKLQRDKIK